MIVISDMMGTLTTGSPVLGLVDWVRHNQSRMQANLYMASMLPNYFLAKRGWIDWQKWGQDLMVDSLALIKDATPEKFAQVAEWTVEYNLWPKRREDVIARLRQHIESGAQVHIASSVFEPGVEAFAKRFGAQAIGTPVEYVNGRVRLAYGPGCQRTQDRAGAAPPERGARGLCLWRHFDGCSAARTCRPSGGCLPG